MTTAQAYTVLYIIPCCYFFVFQPTGPLADEAAVIQLRPIYQHAARWDAGHSLGHPGAADNGPPDTICIPDLLLELSLPNTPSSHTVTQPPSGRFICCVPSFACSIFLPFFLLLPVSLQKASFVSLKQFLLSFSCLSVCLPLSLQHTQTRNRYPLWNNTPLLRICLNIAFLV